MIETEKAYLAGIIDGEGCITITHSTNRKQQLVMVVNMNDKPTMDYIATLTGSNSRIGRLTSAGIRSYQIGLSGRKAQAIIKEILPYLIARSEQANMALAFPVLKRGNQGGLTPDMREMRNEIEAEIKSLNHHYKREAL